MAITSRIIRNRWREMMKRIVACRSQAIADVRSQDAASRYPLVPSRRNVEKWRCRASIIKLHLQSTLHYNTTAYASRLQVGIPVQISRGRVTNDWRRRRHRKKKTILQHRRKGRRCVCRSGPGNRSWFCCFLLINSSHVIPCVPPAIDDSSQERSRSAWIPPSSYAWILPSSPGNLTPSQMFVCIKMLRINFWYNPIKYTVHTYLLLFIWIYFFYLNLLKYIFFLATIWRRLVY